MHYLVVFTSRDSDVLAERETPIQFRTVLLQIINVYNQLSYYDDVALEYWARQDVADTRRRCNNDDQLFQLHKQVALAYVTCWSALTLLPEVFEDANNILSTYGSKNTTTKHNKKQNNCKRK